MYPGLGLRLCTKLFRRVSVVVATASESGDGMPHHPRAAYAIVVVNEVGGRVIGACKNLPPTDSVNLY